MHARHCDRPVLHRVPDVQCARVLAHTGGVLRHADLPDHAPADPAHGQVQVCAVRSGQEVGQVVCVGVCVWVSDGMVV